MSPRKVRLDRRLVDLGLALDRTDAAARIRSGAVRVDGVPNAHLSAQVEVTRAVTLASVELDWVGRGAIKLVGALDDLAVAVDGRVAADLGASTGGFSEVLLRRGARRVYAIDVGVGLLHERIARDDRVRVMDGVNVRHLGSLPEPMDLVVGDLSFISWTLVLPVVARLLALDGDAVLLVKPQFEVARGSVGPGGRVRDGAARHAAIERVFAQALANGLRRVGGVDSHLPGARAGNVEYFVHLRPDRRPTPEAG